MKEGERDLKKEGKMLNTHLSCLHWFAELSVQYVHGVEWTPARPLIFSLLFANYDDLNKWANKPGMSFRNTESTGQKSVKIRLFYTQSHAMRWGAFKILGSVGYRFVKWILLFICIKLFNKDFHIVSHLKKKILFIKDSWKKSQFPQKILNRSTVFNIDNNKKYFLSTKSAY